MIISIVIASHIGLASFLRSKKGALTLITNYPAALDYIHSLPHLHQQNTLMFVKRALAYFDNPQNQIKTVHVTGTNGKGTTCYYLTQLLVNSHQKVATFASPYVVDFTERFLINGQPINSQKIVALTNQVQQAVSDLQKLDDQFYLVEFEFLVVMMFLLCVQERVDYGVIEVGIGAQHDKTNVITPQLSIVTNVAMDHAALIGPTLLDIAQEKAGIIKPQTPVILGALTPAMRKVFVQRADQLRAPVYSWSDDFQATDIHVQNVQQTNFTWSNNQFVYKGLQLKTCAQSQIVDVALALQAYHLLIPDPQPAVISASLAVPGLLARMQVLQTKPLVIVDGAHNLAAIQQLIDDLQPIRQKRSLKILYAAMNDKQHQKILQQLATVATQIVVTSMSETRAATAQDYHLPIGATFIGSWPTALVQTLRDLQNSEILLICGSLHFAGEVLRYYKEKF